MSATLRLLGVALVPFLIYSGSTQVIGLGTGKQSQAINFPAIFPQTYGVAPFTVSATASSGLPVTFSILSGPATLSGTNNDIVTITGIGAVDIEASQSAIPITSPPVPAKYSRVTQASQFINFTAIPNLTYGVAPFTVSATASSGLPVTFSILSGPATLSGTNNDIVTITGIGAVDIEASQSGNADYIPASASQVFAVTQASQFINFTAIPNLTYGAAPFTVSATSTSGLPVTFSILSGPATLSGPDNNIVTITGIGAVDIEASQSGNTDYIPASASQVFAVTQASQFINFAAIPNQQYSGTQFSLSATTLQATSSSGLPVSYGVTGPATLGGPNNNIITITGLGTVSVSASQAGNADYIPSDVVTQKFEVFSPETFGVWENSFGVNTPETAVPENDDVANLLKYLFDINPSRPMTAADRAALPVFAAITVDGVEYLTLTYRQYALVTGIGFNLQTSTDLQTWTTVAHPDLSEVLGADPNTGDPIVEVGVIRAGARQFIRLDVTSP